MRRWLHSWSPKAVAVHSVLPAQAQPVNAHSALGAAAGKRRGQARSHSAVVWVMRRLACSARRSADDGVLGVCGGGKQQQADAHVGNVGVFAHVWAACS